MLYNIKKYLKIFTLLPIIFFEIIKNIIYLKKSEISIVNYHWSFGHQFLYLDWMRLKFPEKKICCYVINDKYNLNKLFDRINFINYKIYLFSEDVSINQIRLKFFSYIVKLFHLIIGYGVFISREDLYYKYSVSAGLKTFDGKFNYYYHINDYFNLVSTNNINPPALSDSDKLLAINKIKEAYHNLNIQRFVVIQLRNKGTDNLDFSNNIRNPGEQFNYREIVKFLAKNNYSVIGLGETNSDIFRDIDGYYDGKIFTDCITRFFFQTNCKIYIGQHSGPLYLAASAGARLFISDAMMFWQGIPGENNYILYKRCYLNGKLLSIDNIIANEKILFGNCFPSDIKILPNTQNDIIVNFKLFYYNCVNETYRNYPYNSLPYLAKNIIGIYSND